MVCSTFTRSERRTRFADLCLLVRAIRLGVIRGTLAAYPPSASKRALLGKSYGMPLPIRGRR